MRRRTAADRASDQKHHTQLQQVDRGIASLRGEFEKHAREMFSYLNRQGIFPKRPFMTKATSGYILARSKTPNYATLLLPDARICEIVEFRRKTGRLFENTGYKPGDTSASHKILKYYFQVGHVITPSMDRVVTARVMTTPDGVGRPCEMLDVFTDFATRIIANHK